MFMAHIFFRFQKYVSHVMIKSYSPSCNLCINSVVAWGNIDLSHIIKI